MKNIIGLYHGFAALCLEIRGTFGNNVKMSIVERFDVHGKLAIENNNEKVVRVTCLLKPHPVSLALTSYWQCNLKGAQYLAPVRFVIPVYSGISIANYPTNYAPKKQGA